MPATNATLLELIDIFFFVDHVDVRDLRNFWPEFIGSGRFMIKSSGVVKSARRLQ